ncbi:uncharacterized protein MONBRDRAFT_31181 [Monosiga brevicollis MX1]|uniref:Uncharacterized protein n=1 Tax=Monosiga brevicollis TaxID=81824 RepID=A9US78_MONBE|nr:uncharacterized protein MONBRDRAFT_31181 [Monosiga brevicollis MX1]EDQ91732.1 predicted protein [Monosiga brevicollis MX1]|eukprot:XP_001743018.1 hypothetical protein [Monosiga brevicollis MX1]
MMWRAAMVAAMVLLLSAVQPAEAGIATVAIDFGSEWIKMALVKPGTPMDIVLNRPLSHDKLRVLTVRSESKRKTANVVALRKGERTFGNDALNTAIKYPKTGFRYLSLLLGQRMDSPAVKEYQLMFPEHKLEALPGHNTVAFRLDEDTLYPVEELVAMILEHANELASEYAEQPISSHIIIIPPFFSQAERRALLSAAELAGLNVLRLMSSSVATGLNYGVFRRKEFNATEQHILFYDIGSTNTIASVGTFSQVKDKSSKVPQVQIKGVGYDRLLGGFQWDRLLQQHLLKAFRAQHGSKLKGDPGANPRALAKLLKEAQRVKTILSANTETFAQIEGLFEERDFKCKVTRDELEAMAAHLYPRVLKPVETALAAANLTLDQLTNLIIIGGGVRMPKIQDILVALR